MKFLVFLSAATRITEGRPTGQNGDQQVSGELLSSIYWLENPCGVSPAAGPLRGGGPL